jgi:POLQ-like helicase
MRPERASEILLGTTRARAKMHEYGVAERDFNRVPRDPAQLFSLAIGMLGDVAVSIVTRQAATERLAETKTHLLFCARFFDSYFESRLDVQLDPYMLLVASATYYLAGLPGSSTVVASRILMPCPDIDANRLEELLSWLLKANFQSQPNLEPTRYRGALQVASLLSEFYLTGAGEEDVLAAARDLRQDVYPAGTPRELLLADLIAAVVLTRHANSTWYTLPRYSELQRDIWTPILQKESFIRELWPAQHLLGDRGLYRGTSAVVQMPTSAGKTRAVDLIIRGAFYSGRTSLAIIVAPFRALCEEIRQALLRTFNNEAISVDELTDVQQADFDLEIFLSRHQVLVMTPEKCLYLLRHSPEITETLGLIVYDEGHQFDSGRRGVTYELLLTSLKASVTADTQTVLVSAVLNNAQAIADWLLGAGAPVVSGTNLLPMSRALAFASWLDPLGRLEFADPTDPEISEFFLPRIIEQQTLQRLGRERIDRVFPERDSSSVGLYLGLKVARSGGVAIFVGTKVTAGSIAAKAVDLYRRQVTLPAPATYSTTDELQRLVHQGETNLGATAAATEAARLGIFSHHGNTPHGIRLAVEYAMKEGLIRVVICTSTLAQGVNLPIRYLIITGAHQGTERIKTRDFHNLLGRAGRAGMHTEGTVIFSDLQIYDGRNNREDRWRWPLTKTLLDPSKSEECKSALLSVLDPLLSVDEELALKLKVQSLVSAHLAGTDGWRRLAQRLFKRYKDRNFDEADLLRQLVAKSDALSAIESFLMAHWNQEPDHETFSVQSLAESTLAFHLATADQRVRLVELFEALAGNIVSNIPEAATRRVFSRSLFGLADNMEIRHWVDQNADTLISRNESGDLLRDIWPLFSRFVKNTLFSRCKPSEALVGLAEKWTAGNPFHGLLDYLNSENCKFGDKRPRRPVIENVVDICEGGFGFDGMLIVGAVAEMLLLARPEEVDAIELLRLLQKQIRYGLLSSLAITLYELGFADRVVAQELATVLGGSSSRRRVIRRMAARQTVLRNVLRKYPSYFTAVLNNVLA